MQSEDMDTQNYIVSNGIDIEKVAKDMIVTEGFKRGLTPEGGWQKLKTLRLR